MEKEELREELLKQVGGLGTEVGTGLALDKATAPLLVSPIPGSRLAYGAINFVGGASSNYAAQRIRGEEDTDWGEVISSGLLGIIPFTSLRFGKRATQIAGDAGTVKRAIVGGAGMGASDRFIQSGLNEGELPSPTDVAVGTVAGGALGGTFQKSFDEFGKILDNFKAKGIPTEQIPQAISQDPKASRHLSLLRKDILDAYAKGDSQLVAKKVFEFRKAHGAEELKNYDSYEQYVQNKVDLKMQLDKNIDDGYVEEIVEQGDNVIFPPGSVEADIQANTQAMASRPEIYVPPNSSQRGKVIRKLIESHLTIGKHHGFDFVGLQNNRRMKSSFIRARAVDIESTPYSRESFDRIRSEDMEWYQSIYGESMDRLGYEPKDIDLDHRVTLVQSLGQYYNVPWGGSLWNDMQKIGLNRGYKPGNTRLNLQLVDPESHRVKTKFFNDLHGKETGMKFWRAKHRDTGLSRIAIMGKSHTNKTFNGKTYRDMHLEIVEDYYDEVDKGSEILDNALALWNAEAKEGILPDEMVESLSAILIEDPEIFNYAPDRLKNLLLDFVREFIDFPLSDLPKGNEGLEILGNRFPFLKGIIDPNLQPLDELSVPEQIRQIKIRSGMTVGEINDALPSGFDLKQLLRTIHE